MHKCRFCCFVHVFLTQVYALQRSAVCLRSATYSVKPLHVQVEVCQIIIFIAVVAFVDGNNQRNE